MNICIIGAGNIASTLGKKWAEAGHHLTFGVRNPADAKYAQLGTIGKISSLADALGSAEVVLLALPGSAVADFANEHGASLAGKIVLDATNNPRSPTMNNLEILQTHAPGAFLVRAFSTLGWENFADPQIGGVQIDLFCCGNAPARAIEKTPGSGSRALLNNLSAIRYSISSLEFSAFMLLWFTVSINDADCSLSN